MTFLEILTPLIFLYAETHYKFKGVYSRLRKKEPEIIADLPRRIKPGAKLPVLILIKDAHQYPIQLDAVAIQISHRSETQRAVFDFASQEIAQPLWRRVLEIPPQKHFKGKTQVDVTIAITQEGKSKIIKNDNYVAASHAPFAVFIAAENFPQNKDWYFGEFHCHTSYTSDQVEFGAPLDATALLAQAMGLHFFCATEHSYDLDDLPDNYLKSDPNLTKWKTMQSEIQSLNQHAANFVIVPGEEVSVGNSKNRNVHFLILNPPEFLPGAGDSAEKWLRTQPDLSIADALGRIDSKSAAFAAHPAVKPPFLEWLLLRRGSWQQQDFLHAGLHGLQIWNGADDGLEEGKRLWIRLLLEGRRIFVCGGSDAHGNFNRFRQIGWPFFSMRENHEHLFGAIRTGVLLDNGLSLSTLLKGFQTGRMVVTNGPFVEIRLHNSAGENAQMGGEIAGAEIALTCECKSTAEFGALSELRIYRGNLAEKKEDLFYLQNDFANAFLQREQIAVSDSGFCYFRAELESKTGERTLLCLTNPIWVKP
jgi:hypothetical protein